MASNGFWVLKEKQYGGFGIFLYHEKREPKYIIEKDENVLFVSREKEDCKEEAVRIIRNAIDSHMENIREIIKM